MEVKRRTQAGRSEATRRALVRAGRRLFARHGYSAVGIEAWLDVCRHREVQQIVLLDGPAVLGWERWREISLRHAGALVEAALAGAIAAGHLRPQPVRPLAVVMIAALDEAALYVARADDAESARSEMMTALGH